jgi:hypothetical protein
LYVVESSVDSKVVGYCEKAPYKLDLASGEYIHQITSSWSAIQIEIRSHQVLDFFRLILKPLTTLYFDPEDIANMKDTHLSLWDVWSPSNIDLKSFRYKDIMIYPKISGYMLANFIKVENDF